MLKGKHARRQLAASLSSAEVKSTSARRRLPFNTAVTSTEVPSARRPRCHTSIPHIQHVGIAGEFARPRAEVSGTLDPQ